MAAFEELAEICGGGVNILEALVVFDHTAFAEDKVNGIDGRVVAFIRHIEIGGRMVSGLVFVVGETDFYIVVVLFNLRVISAGADIVIKRRDVRTFRRVVNTKLVQESTERLGADQVVLVVQCVFDSVDLAFGDSLIAIAAC